jgi:hypothetical protein
LSHFNHFWTFLAIGLRVAWPTWGRRGLGAAERFAMRRPQTVRHHRPRGVRDGDEVVIKAAECRAALGRRHLDDVERLMLVVAIGLGDGTVTFGELKRQALRAVAKAGSIKAAIKVAS